MKLSKSIKEAIKAQKAEPSDGAKMGAKKVKELTKPSKHTKENNGFTCTREDYKDFAENEERVITITPVPTGGTATLIEWRRKRLS